MNPDVELRHIREGHASGESLPPGRLFALDVSTAADAKLVSKRLREALTAVIEGGSAGVSGTASWESRLPSWLLESFRPGSTSSDDDWSLPNWVHWYAPEQRGWFFWDAEVVDAHRLTVFLDATDLPFAHDSLIFLLRAAGATDVSNPIPLRSPS